MHNNITKIKNLNMIKFCLSSKSGKVITDKSLYLPSLPSMPSFSIQSQTYNLHQFHNTVKISIGKILGVPTHTIEENDQLISELIKWKNSDPQINQNLGKKIQRFVEANNNHLKTTVFFENHWKYRFALINLSLLYIDYKYVLSAENYIVDILIGGMVVIHLFTLFAIPFGDGMSLSEVSKQRKTLKNEIDAYKILGKQPNNDQVVIDEQCDSIKQNNKKNKKNKMIPTIKE